MRFNYNNYKASNKKLTKEALEACVLTGIKAADLYEKPFEYFLQGADNEEIAQMRFDHFERRRKDKLSIVLSQVNEMAFKHKVLRDATSKGWATATKELPNG